MLFAAVRDRAVARLLGQLLRAAVMLRAQQADEVEEKLLSLVGLPFHPPQVIMAGSDVGTALIQVARALA